MIKEQKKEYDKEYRQKNKERLKKYQKEYNQKNKKHKKEYNKEYWQKNREQLKEYNQNNKEHKKEYNKKWRQDNKDSNKEYRYKKRYNLTLEEIDQMLIAQDHKCCICGKILMETNRHIDHNCRTGKVRGILCPKCNLGLGHFDDNPEFLRKATLYIEKE